MIASLSMQNAVRSSCTQEQVRALPPLSADDRAVTTTLIDGTPVCLRPIRPDDIHRIATGIAELSDQSRYFRFFSGFANAPAAVVERLAAVDGRCHIAWGAMRPDLADGPAIGAAHAVRSDPLSPSAELAVAVLDAYHGKGLGRMLMAAVLNDARDQGICRIEVEVISGNRAAVMLIGSLGAISTQAAAGVAHYHLDVSEALARLEAISDNPGLRDILRPGGTKAAP